MENSHKYFKRDISWLSFNYRVLLEAEDETLPIYERIKFLSIYSSNLEEFYETFDVKETDKMYRAPENRLKIW